MSLRGLPDPAAVIFDLDGTLVDTVETRIEAWMRTFGEYGVPADREAVALLIGSDGKELAREIAGRAGRELDHDAADDVDGRSGEIYDELNVDPRPLPGACELLDSLARGSLPWAIATSSRAEQVMASVQALRLSANPSIVDGSSVRRAKPAPDLLLLAARELGAAPERCWYVGDATWDMQAAKAAGMVAIGLPTGAVDGAALERAGAAAAVPSLGEIEQELRRRGLVGAAVRD